MKVLLVVLACAVASALAQVPCAAPPQLTFRAIQSEVGGQFFNKFFAQYDRVNQRSVFFEESEAGTKQKIRVFLFLHAQHKGFELDLQTKHCKSFPIGPFRPLEVPPNATFRGEASIGGPGQLVMVDQWTDKVPHRREMWIGDFSLQNCYPLTQFLLEAQDFNKSILTHYADVVVGIANPGDFTVPAECLHAQHMPQISLRARTVRASVSGSFHDF